MADIQDHRLLYLKGGLFLVAGLGAGALLLVEAPSLRVAALLVICVWCLCRAYYFAFYVVEHYVDGQYRFAGLGDFLRYAWRRRFGWRDPEG